MGLGEWTNRSQIGPLGTAALKSAIWSPAEPIPALLTAQQEHHALLPEKLVYDKAAGAGKTIAEVARASDGQTQLVVELRDYGARSTLFAPQDFHLNPDSFRAELRRRSAVERIIATRVRYNGARDALVWGSG